MPRQRRQKDRVQGQHWNLPSGQGVLDGIGECVAQMQGACHIGGWDAHHEDSPGIWCRHTGTLIGEEGWAHAKASHHLSQPPPRQWVLGPAVALPHVLQAWAAEPTHSILGLEEALLLPPWVPGSFHVLRAVGVGHGATDIWGRDGEGQFPQVVP